jgi:hypothetical protein
MDTDAIGGFNEPAFRRLAIAPGPVKTHNSNIFSMDLIFRHFAGITKSLGCSKNIALVGPVCDAHCR